LREGDPSALGLYLDHGQVHIGDLTKIIEDAFSAWISDRAVGLDAIMLAPTRELVAFRIPAGYVTTSTGLRYAITIYSAQGVSADRSILVERPARHGQRVVHPPQNANGPNT
jgi:hypothetical protein